MDNGNFPYAKDIGRVLAKTKLNNSHRGIIDTILDKTYGWPDKHSEKINKFKKMKEYLRPETLFGTKMEGYLQEARDNKNKSKEIIA